MNIKDNRKEARVKAVGYINPATDHSVEDVIRLLQTGELEVEVYEYTNDQGEVKTAIAIKPA